MNVCVIQARGGSSRLPGKVLNTLPFNSNKETLKHIVNRINDVHSIDKVILATTTRSVDDSIQNWCIKNGVECFRGDEDNVLERFYEALKGIDVTNVVRVTGDCPCIDPDVVEEVIKLHVTEDNDYTSNSLVRSFPHGLDVEVFKYSCLEEAYKNATMKHEKEHVTPYIYQTNKEKFKLANYENKYGDYSDMRITLDTVEDYYMLDILFEKLGDNFRLSDLVKFYDNHKPYFNINRDVVQKVVFKTKEEEVQYAKKLLKFQDLHRALEEFDNGKDIN